jgi:hypothetical protein
MKTVYLLLFFLFGLQGQLTAQSYFDERGKRILYPEYEEKILSGPILVFQECNLETCVSCIACQ